MKETTIEKINSVGKVSLVITRVITVLLIICLVISTIGLIACCFLPKDLFTVTVDGAATMELRLPAAWADPETVRDAVAKGDMSTEVNGIKIALTDGAVSGSSVILTGSGRVAQIGFSSFQQGFLVMVLYMALTVVLLWFVARLCKAVRDCATPFCDDVIQKMQHLAYALIPWVVADTVLQGIAQAVFKGGNVNVSVNMGTVLTILIILTLTCVFKYGAKLQQESDETL